jgi:hypothetical protein
MTSTERLNLARNVQAHVRALQAAIDRLIELRVHYELTADFAGTGPIDLVAQRRKETGSGT